MTSSRIIVAGTSSGVGKTSISLGITRALVDRGLLVQAFKIGPDYLDPQHLTGASGRTCFNLDSWMTDGQYIRRVFQEASRDADISVIEGVMGMFDGADPTTIAGSTAEASVLLSSPVVIAVNAYGLAGSIAPMVQGFAEFHQDVTVAGVVANNCGSAGHAEILRKALAAAHLPPLIGAIPRNSLPRIPERHLGLITPEQEGFPPNLFSGLAAAISKYVDLDAVIDLAQSAPELPVDELSTAERHTAAKVRIGIARDKAFFFYYPDNLRLLEQNSAVLVPFSPLADKELPSELDALYIGGGYPEEYAGQLAGNESMLNSIRDFADSGRAVYAECGGLMYLSELLVTKSGESFTMTGILPLSTVMLPRIKALSYAEVTLSHDSLLGRSGTVLRGHEFHYSELQEAGLADDGWQSAYAVSHRSGRKSSQGFTKGNILASYIHLHFGSNPDAVSFFIEHINRSRNAE